MYRNTTEILTVITFKSYIPATNSRNIICSFDSNKNRFSCINFRITK